MPTSSGGNYDSDIENIYAEMENLSEELDNVLAEVDDMLTSWEEEQADNEEQDDNTDTIVNSETTRWSLDVWTDYESFDLLDADLDSNRIEDEDDYAIWLLLYNRNHTVINERNTTVNLEAKRVASSLVLNHLYYETDGANRLLKATATDVWIPVDFASIYSSVDIKEVDIEFSPKSSDRVIVDENHTELYSSGYPSFDWDMDFSNRTDGTCKRIEAETSVRFTLPIPSKFRNSDPEQPYPEQFKLEFELAYKK